MKFYFIFFKKQKKQKMTEKKVKLFYYPHGEMVKVIDFGEEEEEEAQADPIVREVPDPVIFIEKGFCFYCCGRIDYDPDMVHLLEGELACADCYYEFGAQKFKLFPMNRQ